MSPNGGPVHRVTTPPVRVGMLLFTVHAYERGPVDAGEDLVVVRVTVENAVRPLGEAGRAPHVELRDAQGRVFEPVKADQVWHSPRRPGSRGEASLHFHVRESSTRLVVVIGPGHHEEARIALAPPY